MNYPPPLPKDPNPFAKVAANICLAAPLFVIGLCYLLSLLNRSLAGQVSAPGFQQASLAVGGLSCLLMFIGLIMGILALALMKPGSRQPVVLQTMAGIALTGLLCAIAIPNFVRARTAAQQRQKTNAELTAAATELKSETITAIKNKQLDNSNVEHFQQKLNEAAGSASGTQATVLKAMQAYTDRIALLQKNYLQSLHELTAARVLSASNLVDRSELPQRRALVQKFLTSNDELKNFISQNESFYRRELGRLNVPPAELEGFMTGFAKSSRPQSKFVLGIREADDHMGQAMLGTLDLLDREWGHWTYIQTTSRLRFESQAALEQYNALQAQIKQAAADETASQNQLVALLQQAPAPTLH